MYCKYLNKSVNKILCFDSKRKNSTASDDKKKHSINMQILDLYDLKHEVFNFSRDILRLLINILDFGVY